MTDSQKLLAEYVQNGSEAAFRELVARYLDLVYSAAVRLVNGDRHLAEDVAQTVFADLSRLAGAFSGQVMLGGWLHRHTCFVAGKIMRGERRRQSRERQAVELNALQDHPEAGLAQVAPILDDAINQLGAADRTAILLRFFEQRDLRSIGEALGSNEDAARKRVARALDKLHGLLKRRGVAYPAAALGAALANEAVASAPAGLATAISAAALAKAATGGGTALTLVKIITMTKLKLGIIGAVVAAGVAAPLLIQHQAQLKLREENQSLRRQLDQLAQLNAENQRLSNLVAQAKDSQSSTNGQFAELLRLRGQVGQLRAQLRDQGLPNKSRAPSSSGATAQNSNPAATYIPSETWTNAGFATPLAALETAHWAVHTGDVNKFKESILVTDDARQLLNGLLARMASNAPPEALAEIQKRGWGAEEGLMFPMMAQDQNQGYKGYRVLSQTTPAPDEMTLGVELELNSGPSQTRAMRFKRFGADWKQMLDVSDLPQDVRNLAQGK